MVYQSQLQSKHVFVDGGNGPENSNSNNPTLSLIIEALGHGYTPENINVISLGTGMLSQESLKGKKESKIDAEMYWKDSFVSISQQTELTHQKV